MPDIAMCSWRVCPIGDDCYRLQAKPDEVQAYCDFSIEYSAKFRKCKFQIPLLEKGKEPHGN